MPWISLGVRTPTLTDWVLFPLGTTASVFRVTYNNLPAKTNSFAWIRPYHELGAQPDVGRSQRLYPKQEQQLIEIAHFAPLGVAFRYWGLRKSSSRRYVGFYPDGNWSVTLEAFIEPQQAVTDGGARLINQNGDILIFAV